MRNWSRTTRGGRWIKPWIKYKLISCYSKIISGWEIRAQRMCPRLIEKEFEMVNWALRPPPLTEPSNGMPASWVAVSWATARKSETSHQVSSSSRPSWSSKRLTEARANSRWNPSCGRISSWSSSCRILRCGATPARSNQNKRSSQTQLMHKTSTSSWENEAISSRIHI